MKVELQISETYEEEKLIVQAPQPTDKVQKTASQTYNIDLRLYQVLEILPTNFIQISQSEIINIDSISHLKLTPNGLVEIFLKNQSFTYSSRRYLKTIKEKLEL